MQSKFSGARQREQDDAPALISERESKVILQAIAAVQASVDALGLDIERLLETKDAIEAPEWVNGTGGVQEDSWSALEGRSDALDDEEDEALTEYLRVESLPCRRCSEERSK
ncbi:MAG TPA: hypothetical protein VK902_11215 [Rubrobacter sp.]|nr:hypothetical protein [Rubrobacter sp.]